MEEGIDATYRISEVIRPEYLDALEKARKPLDAATRSAKDEKRELMPSREARRMKKRELMPPRKALKTKEHELTN